VRLILVREKADQTLIFSKVRKLADLFDPVQNFPGKRVRQMGEGRSPRDALRSQ
jgi:hypothetical protein